MEEARASIQGQLRMRKQHHLKTLPLFRLSFLLVGVLIFFSGVPCEASDLLKSTRGLLKHKNDTVRADAVMRLAEIDNKDSAVVLLSMATDRSWRVRRAVETAVSRFRNEQALQYLEDMALQPGKPELDAAVALGFGRARHAGAKELLLSLVESKSWSVRRACMEAMGYLGDTSLVPRLASGLSEKEPTLRTVAIDSLAKLGTDEAIDPVVGALSDTEWQVRAAAISALKKFRSKKAIAPLIDVLDREKGRVAQDAWKALTEITGFTFDFDAHVWRSWWERSKDGFRPPPARRAGHLASGSANPATTSKRPKYAAKTTSHYGIQTASKRILFLLDVSQSMGNSVENVILKKIDKKGRYATDGSEKEYGSNIKIEIAKEELIDTIRNLAPGTYFNILAYETRVHSWKKKMVPALDLNKNQAINFVKKQKARGADIMNGTARRGDRVAAEGRTNLFEALEFAFKSAGVGVYDKHYRSGVDTIFLLSDGLPTAGKIVNTREIMNEVSRLNTLRRVVIHTINIGRNAQLLQTLARQSEGTFVDLTPSG